MPTINAESRISTADVASKILRLPATVREALSSETTQLIVSVEGAEAAESLNLSAKKRFLGGVTGLLRRHSLMRKGGEGPELRAADVAWTVEPNERTAALTLKPAGEWDPIRKRTRSGAEAEGVLTSDQQAYLREQAETYAAGDEWEGEMVRRGETSALFRKEVADSGLMEGKALTSRGLARFVEIAWQIQNLNAMVIPQLIGTYTYYRHFKDFSGPPADFSEHMQKLKNWEPGKLGYPGADPGEVGKDLAALLAADDDELGLALQKIDRHAGMGRGLASGLLLLWDPSRHALVNSAAVGPFKQVGGKLRLGNPERAELRELARSRFGLPAGSEYTKTARILGWAHLFDMVRSVCGFDHFFEVDWLLWRISTTAKGEKKARLPVRAVGSSLAKDGDSQYLATPEDLVQLANEKASQERVQVRKQAALDARALIEANLGHLDESAVREVLRLFNVDFYNGKLRANRFSPGFVGATANKLVESIDDVNLWIERVWNADPQAVYGVLTQAWETSAVPSSRSLLSMVLHVKEPEAYNPVMTSLARGYRAMTGKRAHQTGPQYRAYNQYVTQLREAYGLSPFVVDLVLFEASVQAKKANAAATVAHNASAGTFSGVGDSAFRFLRDLRENNSDEWFAARKKEFRAKVREPFRELVSVMGERFAEPVDSELERRPTSPQTMGTIRRNAFGKTSDVYWPHYWAAFHRREFKKTEDFQLYMLIHADYFGFGMATSSATKANRGLFASRLRSLPTQAKRAFEEAIAGGCSILSDEDERRRLDISDASALADILENDPVTICRELTPKEAVARGPALVDDIDATFRAVYPFFALATANDPESVLASYWDDAGSELDREDPSYTVDELMFETLLEPEDVDELVDLLEDKGQAVLYGPPGTGKTWLAERFAKYLTDGGGETRTVQFHPSYGYEDFIEGIRPRIDRETRQPVYVVENGVFLRFCDEARKRRDQRFVLVIDEINRGNLPRIFGELLYLLERRGEQVELPVSGKPFSVPKNLFLLGTMNTADHSIALVDVALRRRFHFKALRPDVPLLRTWLAREVPEMVAVGDLLERLNVELEKEGIDANLQIGHSHFMHPALDEVVLKRVWEHSIIPTLEEYFYGKPKKLARFRWDSFVDVGAFEAAGLESEDDGEDEDADED